MRSPVIALMLGNSSKREFHMPKSTKLSDLIVEEASGVDHPAHLHEGWIVMKSSDLDTALESLNDEETYPTSTEGEPKVELQENEIEGVVAEEEAVVEEASPEVEATPVLASVDSPDLSAVVKELTDVRKELEITQKANEALVEEREMEKALSASQRWAILPELNPTEFAPVLRSVRTADPESAEKIESILDATALALSEAGILKELGTATPESNGGDAYAQIETSARELVESGEVENFAKAVTVVAERQPDLYQRYIEEKVI